MAEEGGKPFLWTGKDPLPREDEILDSNEFWDYCVLPGGQGVTGVEPRFFDSRAGQLASQIVAWPGEKPRSFPAVTRLPEPRSCRSISMCACNNHRLDEHGPLAVRLDGYENGTMRSYLYVCLKDAPMLLGVDGLKMTLMMRCNTRCAISGDLNGSKIEVVKVGGKMNPWGHDHVIAHRDAAIQVLAPIFACTRTDPRKVISVEEDSIDVQQADQFFEALQEATAEINPDAYVRLAPAADYRQSQRQGEETRIDEVSARASKRRKKREEETAAAPAKASTKEVVRAAHARLFNPNPRKKPKLSAPVPAAAPASVPAAASAPALAAPAPAPAPVAPAPAPATHAEREVIAISSDDEEAPAPAPAPAPAQREIIVVD